MTTTQSARPSSADMADAPRDGGQIVATDHYGTTRRMEWDAAANGWRGDMMIDGEPHDVLLPDAAIADWCLADEYDDTGDGYDEGDDA